MDLDLHWDLSAFCRVCMEVTTSKSDNIFITPSGLDQPNLYTMLRAVCSPAFPGGTVDTSDNWYEDEDKSELEMPRNVCVKCKQDVVAAYELHLRCIETNRKLHELVSMNHARKDSEMKLLNVCIKVLPVEQEYGVEKCMESSNDAYELVKCEEQAPKVSTKVKQKAKRKSVHQKKKAKDAKNTVKPKVPKGKQKKPATPSSRIIKPKKEKESTPTPKQEKAPKQYAKPNPCELCPEVFASRKLLQTHMKSVHAAVIAVCDICQVAFSTNEKFLHHRQFHLTGPEYVCRYCDKRYTNKSSFQSHYSLVHDFTEPLRCEVCEKPMVSKAALKTHVDTYHKLKPFPCDRCPLRFLNKLKLDQHYISHTKERNHICDICGARFCWVETLKVHIKRIHERQRNHACSLCDMRFFSREHLRRHMLTHTGEKPHKCLYCDRAYAQSNDLVKHTKIHVGENPYGCDQCEARFRLMAELRDHYAVHSQPGGTPENASTVYEAKTMFTVEATLKRRFALDRQRVGDEIL